MKRPLLVLLLAFFAARLLGQQCVLDTTFGIGGRTFIDGSHLEKALIALPDSSLQYAGTLIHYNPPYDASFSTRVHRFSDRPLPSPAVSYLYPGNLGNNEFEGMDYRNGTTYLCVATGVTLPDDGIHVSATDSRGENLWGYSLRPANSTGYIKVKDLVAGWERKTYFCGGFRGSAYVSCLDASGRVDPSWNEEEMKLVHWSLFNGYPLFNSIEQDHEGRIVAAGTVRVSDQNSYLFMARFMRNGQLDLDFGNGGISVFDHPDRVNETLVEIHVLAENQYVLTGHISDARQGFDPADADVFALRVQENGQADASYGTGGWAVHDVMALGERNECVDSEALLDGRILLAGSTLTAMHLSQCWMMLLDGHGQADTSFGALGTYAPLDSAYSWVKAGAVCRHPAGKIYLVVDADESQIMYRFNYAAAGGWEQDDEPAPPPPMPFGLYPNPVQSGAMLWMMEEETVPVQLLDLQGRLVAEWPRSGELQLPQVAAGLYLVRAGGTTRRLQVR